MGVRNHKVSPNSFGISQNWNYFIHHDVGFKHAGHSDPPKRTNNCASCPFATRKCKLVEGTTRKYQSILFGAK